MKAFSIALFFAIAMLVSVSTASAQTAYWSCNFDSSSCGFDLSPANGVLNVSSNTQIDLNMSLFSWTNFSFMANTPSGNGFKFFVTCSGDRWIWDPSTNVKHEPDFDVDKGSFPQDSWTQVNVVSNHTSNTSSICFGGTCSTATGTFNIIRAAENLCLETSYAGGDMLIENMTMFVLDNEMPAADSTPPGIVNVTTNATTSTIIVNITANESVNRTLTWGLNTSLANGTLANATMGTSGIITITGIPSNTTVYFNITITDASGNNRSNGTYSATTLYNDIAVGALIFTSNTDSGSTPLSVTFSCAIAGGNEPITYLIDFGNGVNTSSNSTTYTYSNAGIYTSRCTAIDLDGDQDSTTIGIQATHVPAAGSSPTPTSTVTLDDSPNTPATGPQKPTCAITYLPETLSISDDRQEIELSVRSDEKRIVTFTPRIIQVNGYDDPPGSFEIAPKTFSMKENEEEVLITYEESLLGNDAVDTKVHLALLSDECADIYIPMKVRLKPSKQFNIFGADITEFLKESVEPEHPVIKNFMVYGIVFIILVLFGIFLIEDAFKRGLIKGMGIMALLSFFSFLLGTGIIIGVRAFL